MRTCADQLDGAFISGMHDAMVGKNWECSQYHRTDEEFKWYMRGYQHGLLVLWVADPSNAEIHERVVDAGRGAVES
jgi:hypothetical protein